MYTYTYTHTHTHTHTHTRYTSHILLIQLRQEIDGAPGWTAPTGLLADTWRYKVPSGLVGLDRVKAKATTFSQFSWLRALPAWHTAEEVPGRGGDTSHSLSCQPPDTFTLELILAERRTHTLGRAPSHQRRTRTWWCQRQPEDCPDTTPIQAIYISPTDTWLTLSAPVFSSTHTLLLINALFLFHSLSLFANFFLQRRQGLRSPFFPAKSQSSGEGTWVVPVSWLL